jgi:hypothetical protein
MPGLLLAKPFESNQFFKMLSADFDTAAPLCWSFLLDGASEDKIGALINEISSLGFAEVEPITDENCEGQYSLWFSEVCIHTARSFATRVAVVEQFAESKGLVVSDFSAGF